MKNKLDFQLTHLKAVVTAGAQGIGRAITEALVQQGAQVHVCDIQQASLDDV